MLLPGMVTITTNHAIGLESSDGPPASRTPRIPHVGIGKDVISKARIDADSSMYISVS